MTATSGLSADTQALLAFESNKKSAGVAYLLWFFTGGVGGHRFYLGRTGSAVCQAVLGILGFLTLILFVGFLLLGALGIWLLIDLFTLGGMVDEHNRKLVDRLNVGTQVQASPVDELGKFAALRDSGAITADEYDAQKARLIGASPTA